MFVKPIRLLVPFCVVLMCCFTAWLPHVPLQTNTAPVVTITKPLAQDKFNWNTLVPYSIRVEDKEDGTSAYDEIAPNEVYLKIRFVPDSANIKTLLASEMKSSEPRELTLIKSSDCFNCHAFKSKVIGPSFATMAKQHAANTNAVSLLSKKIINGSQATVGTEKMPAHPELAAGQAADMVRWILKNGADPNVDHLRGLEGALRTQAQPTKNAGRAVYIITASYTDHGLAQQPGTRKQGKHSMVLRSRP